MLNFFTGVSSNRMNASCLPSGLHQYALPLRLKISSSYTQSPLPLRMSPPPSVVSCFSSGFSTSTVKRLPPRTKATPLAVRREA